MFVIATTSFFHVVLNIHEMFYLRFSYLISALSLSLFRFSDVPTCGLLLARVVKSHPVALSRVKAVYIYVHFFCRCYSIMAFAKSENMQITCECEAHKHVTFRDLIQYNFEIFSGYFFCWRGERECVHFSITFGLLYIVRHGVCVIFLF